MNKVNNEINRTEYIYGNAVRKTAPVRVNPTPERRGPVPVEHNPGKNKQGIGLLYIAFLTVMLGILVGSFLYYVRLNSQITALSDRVSIAQQKLDNLTLENDDEYSKMINTIDYDEIRRVAIEDLGMVYPSEDQIITYTLENSDYVRQFNNLSD